MSEIDGLPNVIGLENLEGLSDAVTSDKGQVAPAAAQTQVQAPVVPVKPTEEKPRNALGQFKTPEDQNEGYKQLQGFATRIAQENKELKENFAKLQESVELMRYRQPPPQPQPQGKDFDSLFIENPQQAVAAVASQAVQKQMQTIRIAEVLDEENDKNPQEYQERFAYANQLGSQYPQLTQSSAGVKKLFRMADEARKVDYQKRGMAFVKAVIGEDVDFDKFRAALRKDQSTQINQSTNAYMPDTTTSSRTGPETEKIPSHEAEIQTAVKKGDIDAVLNAQFKALGLRT